jgi:hypothetical protein
MADATLDSATTGATTDSATTGATIGSATTGATTYFCHGATLHSSLRRTPQSRDQIAVAARGMLQVRRERIATQHRSSAILNWSENVR